MNCQTASLRKFRVLNASAKLVCNAPRFCHITPIMRDLHWLPIKARINFKVLHLTFKALHGLAPQYQRSLISMKTSCYNLRGSNTLLLAMPSVKSSIFFFVYFSFFDSLLYNIYFRNAYLIIVM